MSAYLDDVAYWVREWRADPSEIISGSVALAIAAYWQNSAETGVLAAFALGQAVEREALLEDIDSTIRYVRSAPEAYDLTELEALRAWVQTQPENRPVIA